MVKRGGKASGYEPAMRTTRLAVGKPRSLRFRETADMSFRLSAVEDRDARSQSRLEPGVSPSLVRAACDEE